MAEKGKFLKITDYEAGKIPDGLRNSGIKIPEKFIENASSISFVRAIYKLFMGMYKPKSGVVSGRKYEFPADDGRKVGLFTIGHQNDPNNTVVYERLNQKED
jgi:hypothetical protein